MDAAPKYPVASALQRGAASGAIARHSTIGRGMWVARVSPYSGADWSVDSASNVAPYINRLAIVLRPGLARLGCGF
jgi:hypothetical protein